MFVVARTFELRPRMPTGTCSRTASTNPCPDCQPAVAQHPIAPCALLRSSWVISRSAAVDHREDLLCFDPGFECCAVCSPSRTGGASGESLVVILLIAAIVSALVGNGLDALIIVVRMHFGAGLSGFLTAPLWYAAQRRIGVVHTCPRRSPSGPHRRFHDIFACQYSLHRERHWYT